jgi:hypothetical protein
MSARGGPESALSGDRPRHPRQPGPERRPPCRLGPPARLWLPLARWSQPSAAACCTPAASWQYLGTPGPVGGGRSQDAPPTLTSPGWVPPAVAPGPARREAGPGGGPQQWPGAAGPALSVGHPGRGARVPGAARVCGGQKLVARRLGHTGAKMGRRGVRLSGPSRGIVEERLGHDLRRRRRDPPSVGKGGKSP